MTTLIVEELSTAWNYADLLEKVAAWTHRVDLVDQIVDFVSLAEDEINTELRIRLMQVSEPVTLVAGTRTVALPARYLEPIKLELVVVGSTNQPLHYLPPAQLSANEAPAAAGRPEFWTVNEDTLEFQHLADQNYTLNFRMLKGFNIAETNTNDLLTRYRGLYLYGALMQAAPYMVNDARITVWRGMYESLKAKVAKRESRNQVLTQLRTDVPTASISSNFLGR